MRKILQSPILVPLIATAVIILVVFQMKNYERAALSYFLRGTVPTPHFIQAGSIEDGVAWHVRSISDQVRDGDFSAPGVVQLEDDPEGVFQSSPHAPIDLALIARNLKQVGGDTVAVGAVMAWDTPDVIGLAALERALDEFESVVATVPLARGATAESMPQAFRRASVSLEQVRGDASNLPAVNRVAIPDALLGGENAIAGFTTAGTPADGGQPHLLAQWEDRVVFSFPFLVAMQQARVSLDSLHIHLGSHIHVGSGGWIIPIDESGRLKVRVAGAHDFQEISAEQLLESATRANLTASSMWLVRDDRSSSDAAMRLQSAELAPLVQTLSLGAALTKPKELKSVPPVHGWVLLGAVVVLLGTLSRYGAVAIQVGLVLTLVGLIALQWAALSLASLWMPAMPAILAANVVWVIAFPIILTRRKPRAAAALVMEQKV